MPKYRNTREALWAADPNLKIITPRHRHKNKKRTATAVDSSEWDAAEGKPCPKCGIPDVRFINGVCRNCYGKQRQKIVKEEASLRPVLHCKDKKLASRVQKYLAKLDRKL